MTNSQIHSGQCQCGAVRFQASGAPKFVSYCHCNSCRRATGAIFSTWVGFDVEKTKWMSKPKFFASSTGVKRGYCDNCGTPLSYEGEKWAGELHFLIGVFDSPEIFKPTAEAFREEALPWAHERPAKS